LQYMSMYVYAVSNRYAGCMGFGMCMCSCRQGYVGHMYRALGGYSGSSRIGTTGCSHGLSNVHVFFQRDVVEAIPFIRWMSTPTLEYDLHEPTYCIADAATSPIRWLSTPGPMSTLVIQRWGLRLGSKAQAARSIVILRKRQPAWTRAGARQCRRLPECDVCVCSVDAHTDDVYLHISRFPSHADAASTLSWLCHLRAMAREANWYYPCTS
jgi:hypothetical protein